MIYNCKPGTVISVPKPPFTHYGVWVPLHVNGPSVISNSFKKGQVVIEPLNVFCGDHTPTIHDMWGKYTSYQVIERAKRFLGRSYSASKFNCEHFVRSVHGLSAGSPQFDDAIKTVAMLGIGYMLLSSK